MVHTLLVRSRGLPGTSLRRISLRSQSGTAVALGILTFALVVAAFSLAAAAQFIAVIFPLLAIWLLLSRVDDRFDPSVLFPAMYLLWYWIGSLSLFGEGGNLGILARIPDRQWLFYLIGFMGLWCGTLLIKDKQPKLSNLRGMRVHWKEGALLMVLLLMGAIMLASWASITAVEGIPILSPDVETLRVEISSRHRVAYQLMVASADVLLPMIYLYLWTTPMPRLKRLLQVTSVFIVLMFFSQGNRGLALVPLLTLFVLRHYLRKPWSLRLVASLGVILLPLLSVTGYFRSLQHFGPTYAFDLADAGIPPALQPFTNVYLYVRAPQDTFRNIVALIPLITPYQHGQLSAGFVLQLLPGRHPSSDFFFKDLLGHSFEGFGEPASVLGTFYADFGALGIIVGMFFTGLLSRVVYMRMFRRSAGWILVYCFLWQKLLSSLYGSLFTYVVEILIPITWLVLVWALTNSIEYNGVQKNRSIEP